MNIVYLYTAQQLEDALYENLRQRRMPDCFLYMGNSGAENWLDLEQSQDFTVASRLTELLARNVDGIAGALPDSLDVVTVGAGDGRKERRLLQALLAGGTIRYTVIDVSSKLVGAALQTAEDLEVEKLGIVAFWEDLPKLRRYWDSPFLLGLLGNNFSNYRPEQLLELVSSQMNEDDYFLFDAHLHPGEAAREDQWRMEVEEAYGSEKNARFNMWPIISHGADPRACRFNIALTEVETSAGSVYRTHKEIRILKPITLEFGDEKLELAEGEVIEMGFTYKYTLDTLRKLLAAEGFNTVKEFCDERAENALLLVKTC